MLGKLIQPFLMKIEIEERQKPNKRLADIGFKANLDILKRFTNKQKQEFYREFATLIKSGVDYNQALRILSSQQKSKFLKTLFDTINKDIIKGKAFNQAIKEHKYFSPYEFYSIKIGEETGRLSDIFDQLHTYFTRKIKMRRQITSVLAYPIFVLFITFGVLYFMLNYVVPMFSSIFKQFGKELPKITQLVLNLSEQFNVIALTIVGAVIVAFFGHKFLSKYESYNSMRAKLLLKIPFFGALIKKIYLARFCQSFSLLLAAKTPLITTVELTNKMISFYPLKKALEHTKYDILKGETLTNSLKKHSIFTAKIISLTEIGEQVNELDEIYDKLANQYNEDIDHSTKLIGTILEPVMILLIASIVGFIMIAMYSPIFDLSKILER